MHEMTPIQREKVETLQRNIGMTLGIWFDDNVILLMHDAEEEAYLVYPNGDVVHSVAGRVHIRMK